jgi:hypothetical protein
MRNIELGSTSPTVGVVYPSSEIPLPRDKGGRIRWSKLSLQPDLLIQAIETEARSFILGGGFLSLSGLDRAKMSALRGAISSYYPGGIVALKETLEFRAEPTVDYSKSVVSTDEGLPRDRRGRIRWAVLKSDPEQLLETLRAQAQQFSQQAGGLTQKLLAERGRSDLDNAISSLYPGGLNQLKTDLGQASTVKPDGYWKSAENILAEARAFLETNVFISYTIVKKSGYSSLNTAVSQSYPGGWVQLRADLGIPVARRANSYWNETTIEQEAKRFLVEYGSLNSILLASNGRGDLALAISRKYPGQWPVLYERLGLEAPQKEKGYWTTERIEAEAREFYKECGNLSATSLASRDRVDLLAVIRRRYPGQMSNLKRKLGIPVITRERYTQDESKPRGYWLIPENIEREAQELIDSEGILNWEASKKHGKTTLLEAIRRTYPGGTKALKAKLKIEDISRPVGYWNDPENIEREAREVLEKEGTITQKLLAEHGKSGLTRGLRLYPGGLAGLLQKLGVVPNRRVNYWTPETIEQEAKSFLEKFGQISQKAFRTHQRYDLQSAISGKYPGGLAALRRNLGMGLSEISSQEANSDLERLLE